MFQHPALRKNTSSRSFAGLPLQAYVVVKTTSDWKIRVGTQAWQQKVKNLGLVGDDGVLPAGAVILARTYSSGLSDYLIISINGQPINLETDIWGMGTAEEVMQLALERGERLFDIDVNATDALSRAQSAAADALAGREAGTSDVDETDTLDAGSTSSASTSAPAPTKTSTPSYTPKTGYYKDSGGYAWYYNASQDYMEAIAAPKGKYKTQPRFSNSSGEQYTKMKGVLTAANATDRATAIKNATDSGGEALPERTASAPPAAAPVPPDVANRGAAQKAKKKGVPAWVWWTSGTVLVAGLGVWGAIMIKKNKAAAQ